jgi:methenyltetrahydromethanopterin cyclohydrolase
LPRWPWHLSVRSSQPVTACLASQYAGWALRHDGEQKFFALGSGPARALARREPLFSELAHQEQADRAVLVVEANAAPPPAILEKVAKDCGVASDRLTVLFAPVEASPAQCRCGVWWGGAAQAHAGNFHWIASSTPPAVAAQPSIDLATSMGRTNDASSSEGECICS